MKSILIENILEEIYLCEGSKWRVRDLRNLSESGQKDVTTKTITTLFRDIKSKAFDLDFKDVEVGKGDITKINSYKELQNAISFLKKLSMNIKSPEIMDAITQIELSHNNLISHKQEFVIGFNLGNNLIIYLFNSVAIALVQSVSFLISQSIELTKDSMNVYSCNMKDVKKLPKNANLSALRKFNEMAKSGKLHTALSSTVKKEVAVVAVTLTVIGSILLALVLIREIVFAYFYVRISLSSYLKHLKEFVNMNAGSLGTGQKKIKDKQENIAKKLGDLSDKLSVDQDMATERSKSSINQNNKNTSNNNTPENTGELSDILY